MLKEIKNKEIITDKNKPVNLLLEGDNYHALAVLNDAHNKKVDVIYIDPHLQQKENLEEQKNKKHIKIKSLVQTIILWN